MEGFIKLEGFNEQDYSLANVGSPINPQLYFFKLGSDYICYAPYSRFAAKLNKVEYNYLISHKYLTIDAPKTLCTGGFYKKAIDNRAQKKAKESYMPTQLTVFLGDACNLNCIYCNATTNRKYTFDSEKTIRAVSLLLDKYFIKDIDFFGNGEPLLYFNTIRKITESAKSKGIESFYICTNGIILNNREEIIKFLVENNFYIQLSIDGYAAIQDSQRPTKATYYSSSKEIEKTISEIKKYGELDKFAFARFTLTYEALEHIKEILLYFKELGFKKVRGATLIEEGNGVKNKLHPIDLNSQVDNIINAIIFAEQIGIDFTGDFDMRSPSESSIYPCPYMAGEAVSLNEGLKLLSCLEDVSYYQIGGIDLDKNQINIDMEVVNKFKQRNELTLNCESCPVKCGGGCTHSSFISSGRLDLPGDYLGKCTFLRTALYTYLKKKFDGD